jgi:hypothetical protein
MDEKWIDEERDMGVVWSWPGRAFDAPMKKTRFDSKDYGVIVINVSSHDNEKL